MVRTPASPASAGFPGSPGSPASDTPPEVEERQIEAYRRMSGTERLTMALEMTRAVQELAKARILAQYGMNLPERELRLRLAALHLDRETMIRAFGWDPEVEGY